MGEKRWEREREGKQERKVRKKKEAERLLQVQSDHDLRGGGGVDARGGVEGKRR